MIENRVEKSGLIQLNLEEWYPEMERVAFDLKDLLFQEMILREKDFRLFLKEHDFSQYQGKAVAIICTADAIIPTWAYMLLAVKFQPFASKVVVGSLQDLEGAIFKDLIDGKDWAEYQDAKVVVKGCSKYDLPESVYFELAAKLSEVASSIMFGEPCSTVPVFKKPRK